MGVLLSQGSVAMAALLYRSAQSCKGLQTLIG